MKTCRLESPFHHKGEFAEFGCGTLYCHSLPHHQTNHAVFTRVRSTKDFSKSPVAPQRANHKKWTSNRRLMQSHPIKGAAPSPRLLQNIITQEQTIEAPKGESPEAPGIKVNKCTTRDSNATREQTLLCIDASHACKQEAMLSRRHVHRTTITTTFEGDTGDGLAKRCDCVQ